MATRLIFAITFVIVTCTAATQSAAQNIQQAVASNNLNQVKLGAKLGELEGFIAGRPFPEEPDINDPRAGEKLAWNYKYGYNWGDNAAITPFYWRMMKILKRLRQN